jgi:hypothetical protein
MSAAIANLGAVTDFLQRWTLDRAASNVHLYTNVAVPMGMPFDHVLCIGTEFIVIDLLSAPRAKFLKLENGEVVSNRWHRPRYQPRRLSYWNAFHEGSDMLSWTWIIATDAKSVIRNIDWFRSDHRLVELSRLEELLEEKFTLYVDPSDTRGLYTDAAEQCEAWGGVKLL